MLLKDSLNGKSMTAIITCINPGKLNHSEIYNSLQFADRAKTIRTKAVLNVEKSSDANIKIKNLE